MTAVETDRAAILDDLVTFARLEWESGDLEPWAALLAHLHAAGTLDHEQALWLVKLYNAYDSLGSAWAVFRRWPTPEAWSSASDWRDAAAYPCTNERRNLRAGKVLRHLDGYVAALNGRAQADWTAAPLRYDDPFLNWASFTGHVRPIWGVGRQTAFEWAEFVMKVTGAPMDAPDADLWESEGPRRSLQRIYGNPRPTLAWLNERAAETRHMLAGAGVPLPWVDFETVICDFNVGRDGRYYPGRHLAALREEIDSVAEPDRALLLGAFRAVIPEPWRNIAPGIDKAKMAVYRDTGRWIDAP